MKDDGQQTTDDGQLMTDDRRQTTDNGINTKHETLKHEISPK